MKPVVLFCNESEILMSKKFLHKSLVDLNVSDSPRIIKHQGDNKVKQSSDDLFELLQLADENLDLDKLPSFVALDLSRVPYLSSSPIADEGMNERISKLEGLYSS